MFLQTPDAMNFARHSAELAGRMALGRHSKRIIWIENEIHHSVAGSSKPPTIPFHILQLTIRKAGLSQNLSLISFRLKEPTTRRAHVIGDNKQ